MSHQTSESGPGGQTHRIHSTCTSSTHTSTSNDWSNNMTTSTHGKVTKKKRATKNERLDEYVPFYLNRYADGANALLYMRPPSSPPRNCTHDRKHQKKKGSRSRQNKPNKLNLLPPLPDFRSHSVHHSLKYDRE